MNGEFNRFIEGERLYLREVRLSDVNENYYRWMNDPQVTTFLEIRFNPHSIDDIKRYVERLDGRSDEIFLAICLKEKDRHIGNIKLGPINWLHRFGDVSLVIGEKDCWNHGYATESIRILCDFARTALGLHKANAGVYKLNAASINVFVKAGFKIEGEKEQHYFLNGKYVDIVTMGRVLGL